MKRKKKKELFDFGLILESDQKRKEVNHLYMKKVDGIHVSLQREEKYKGEVKLRVINKKKDKENVEELKGYLLGYLENIQPFEKRGVDVPSDMRGMGTIESNIDKILVIRVNNQGVSWTKKNLKDISALIIVDRNNEL